MPLHSCCGAMDDGSDGGAVGCGDVNDPSCFVPPLTNNMRYIQAAAGCNRTVLLRSDGNVISFGPDACVVPVLPEELIYTQVAANNECTVLVRSDGKAFVHKCKGLCYDVSQDHPGIYIHAAVGANHIVIVRSDGTAFAIGHNFHGKIEVPKFKDGMTYVGVAPVSTVLQASHNGITMSFGNLYADNVLQVQIQRFSGDSFEVIGWRIALWCVLGPLPHDRIKIVLPSGRVEILQ